MIAMFEKMPQNFVISFIREQTRKKKNTPFEVLFPRISPCSTQYQNMNKDPQGEFGIITIHQAEGIPFSDEYEKDVVYREMKRK